MNANGDIPSWASKLKKQSIANCGGPKISMSAKPSAPRNEDRKSQKSPFKIYQACSNVGINVTYNSGKASHVHALNLLCNKSWKFGRDSNFFGKGSAVNSTNLYGSLLRSITSERLRQRHATFAWTSQEFHKLQTLLQRHAALSQGKSNIIKGENFAPSEKMGLVKAPDSCLDLSLTWEGISYVDYRRVGFLMPSKTRSFFRPSTFLKFRRDQFGNLDVELLYEYAHRVLGLLIERFDLSQCDTNGDGLLRESDVEFFFEDFLDRVPPLKGLQDDFRTYYIFTAVRKVFFFLDAKRRLKVSLRRFLTSAVFREVRAIVLTSSSTAHKHIETNWFSGANAMHVYRKYLSLDIDQNGMLSKHELAQYNGGSLTTCFLDRVWEESRTYLNDINGEREMDYKVFLDFTLAMENKDSSASLRWFFNILDVCKSGYLDFFVLKYYFRHVQDRLGDNEYIIEDVIDEIFDMVKPKTKHKIKLQDLIDSGVGGTVISILIDVNGFWVYDNRENYISSEYMEQQQKVSYSLDSEQ